MHKISQSKSKRACDGPDIVIAVRRRINVSKDAVNRLGSTGRTSDAERRPLHYVRKANRALRKGESQTSVDLFRAKCPTAGRLSRLRYSQWQLVQKETRRDSCQSAHRHCKEVWVEYVREGDRGLCQSRTQCRYVRREVLEAREWDCEHVPTYIFLEVQVVNQLRRLPLATKGYQHQGVQDAAQLCKHQQSAVGKGSRQRQIVEEPILAEEKQKRSVRQQCAHRIKTRAPKGAEGTIVVIAYLKGLKANRKSRGNERDRLLWVANDEETKVNTRHRLQLKTSAFTVKRVRY